MSAHETLLTWENFYIIVGSSVDVEIRLRPAAALLLDHSSTELRYEPTACRVTSLVAAHPAVGIKMIVAGHSHSG